MSRARSSRSTLSTVGLLCALSAAPRAPAEEASPAAVGSAAAADAADAGAAKPPSIVIEETESQTEPPPPLPAGEEKRAIGEYILTHSDGVHDCYKARLRDLPTLQGRLYARFQIGPNGHVIGATADGIGDPVLIACVLNEVRKWQFEKPASGGKLRAAYPYVFRPDPTQ